MGTKVVLNFSLFKYASKLSKMTFAVDIELVYIRIHEEQTIACNMFP